MSPAPAARLADLEFGQIFCPTGGVAALDRPPATGHEFGRESDVDARRPHL